MSLPFDITAINWTMIGVLVAIATLIVAVLAWRRPRGANPAEAVQGIRLLGHADYPNIHATNGVPSLDQLTEGIALNPKRRAVAQLLYCIGLDQFNHYINNLDSVIADAQASMAELKPQLNRWELSLADNVGLALATDQGEELRAAKARYDALRLPAQIYAEHKRQEHQARQCITSILHNNIPRTDYTSVKSMIASGNFSITSITSELPLAWQDLRTLDQEVEIPEPTEKPPKREFHHVEFRTRDMGVLEDRRAERDGEWLISRRHRMMAPYQKPARILRFKNPARPPVPTGEYRIIINQNMGSEWIAKFYRKGGRLDQTYQRAKSGTSPEQLRSAYRRRMIRRIGWYFAASALAVDIVLLAFRFL